MPLQNWQRLGRECFDIRIGVGISSESSASLVCRVNTGSTQRGVLFRFNTVHSNMLSNRTPWITGKLVPAQALALQRLSEQWECRSIGSLLAEPKVASVWFDDVDFGGRSGLRVVSAAL